MFGGESVNNFWIKGGNRLEGIVRISGAKNAVLPILAATILAERPCIICNVPDLHDVHVMKDVLHSLGISIRSEDSILEVDPSRIYAMEISDTLAQKMRASNLVLGPLLAKFGWAKISYPGGCAIGTRPIDLHLKGLRMLGAEFWEKPGGYIEAKAKELRGTNITLDFPSVGATENIMMAAVLAKGETCIINAAREPEIEDLQNFLNAMGAKIAGAGTNVIRIEGVSSLHGCTHKVIPDRIEAGTYLIAAAITGGQLRLENTNPEHLKSFTARLEETGLKIIENNDCIEVYGSEIINPVDIITLPYPGFPTDLQAPMMALLTIAKGTSVITETIFDKRFQHVGELCRMGANIRVEGRLAVIKGVEKISGAHVSATDLRAGAALILAGLAAEGETIVEGAYFVERGYEKVVEKLTQVGAQIKKVS